MIMIDRVTSFTHHGEHSPKTIEVHAKYDFELQGVLFKTQPLLQQ
jgi:hypothetical protein